MIISIKGYGEASHSLIHSEAYPCIAVNQLNPSLEGIFQAFTHPLNFTFPCTGKMK